ncbi:uncharacterized protein V6R79_021893 [Siganus canaliculatus]
MERIDKMKQLLDPSSQLFGQLCYMMVEQLEDFYRMVQPGSILELREQSERHTEEMKTLCKRLDSVTEEMKKDKDQAGELEKQNHDTYEEQIRELKQQVQDLQQRENTREEKIGELQQHIQELTKENYSCRKQHEEAFKSTEAMEAKMKKLIRENQLNQQKIKDLCEKHATVKESRREEKKKATSTMKCPSQGQTPSGSPSSVHGSSHSGSPSLSGSPSGVHGGSHSGSPSSVHGSSHSVHGSSHSGSPSIAHGRSDSDSPARSGSHSIAHHRHSDSGSSAHGRSDSDSSAHGRSDSGSSVHGRSDSGSSAHGRSDSDSSARSGSHSSSDSDSPAPSQSVDRDVHNRGKKMGKGRQERPADRHLQDQLDHLRGLVENVMQSLPSQLPTLSHTKEGEGGAKTLRGQKSKPALDEKSKAIDDKLTVIIDQYEHLKITVQSLVKFQDEKEVHSPEKLELEKNIQETILQLQHECTKLADITGLHQSRISALENEQVAQKLQTDQLNQQLSEMFHEVLEKVTSQEKRWSKVIHKLSTEMDEKLNRPELRQVENRWRGILKKLQSEKEPEKKSATAVKTYLSNRFRCLACDQDVNFEPGIRPFSIKVLEKVQQTHPIRKPETRSTQKNDVSLLRDKKAAKDLLEVEKSKAVKDVSTASSQSESSAGGYTNTSSRKVTTAMAQTTPFKPAGGAFTITGRHSRIYKGCQYPATRSIEKQTVSSTMKNNAAFRVNSNPLDNCLVVTKKQLHPRLLERERLKPNFIKP